MYALVNTMDRSDRSYGRILFRCRSLSAAIARDREFQRGVRAANGATSYIPTIVCCTTKRAVGSAALRTVWEQVSDEDYILAQAD
mgnify:CR=1 FL=1